MIQLILIILHVVSVYFITPWICNVFFWLAYDRHYYFRVLEDRFWDKVVYYLAILVLFIYYIGGIYLITGGE